MKLTRQKLRNMLNSILLSEAYIQRKPDGELLDDENNTNSKFIEQLHEAVVEGTGSTGFGFIFERIVCNPEASSVLELVNPEVLNLTDSNIEFADIIDDNGIYYSVKCSIWEGGSKGTGALITEVNSSKPSSLIKLGLKLLKERKVSPDVDGNVRLKVGVIAGHPSAEHSRGSDWKGLGIKIEVFKPDYENIIVKKDQYGEYYISKIDEAGGILQNVYPTVDTAESEMSTKAKEALEKKRNSFLVDGQYQLFADKRQTAGATSVSAFQKNFYADVKETTLKYFVLYPLASATYKLETPLATRIKIAEIAVDSVAAAALRATSPTTKQTAAERKETLKDIQADSDYTRAHSKTAEKFGDTRVTTLMGQFGRSKRGLRKLEAERDREVRNVNEDTVAEISDLCEIIKGLKASDNNQAIAQNMRALLSRFDPEVFQLVKKIQTERMSYSFGLDYETLQVKLNIVIIDLIKQYPNQETLDYIKQELQKTINNIQSAEALNTNSNKPMLKQVAETKIYESILRELMKCSK